METNEKLSHSAVPQPGQAQNFRAMSDADADALIRSAADRTRAIEAKRATPKLAPTLVVRRAVTPEENQRYQDWLAARSRAERVAACHHRSNVPEHFKTAKHRDTSNIPDDAVEPYTAATVKLHAAISKPGIYALCGAIGDGKTHMACGIINAFCDEGRSAKYMKAGDYVRNYRATWKVDAAGAESAYEAQHIRITLLVLDEWQVRNDTENENLILLGLLDKRYDAGKTTILISNHANRQEFDASIDSRVSDRMHDGGGVIICNWRSLRGRIARAA